MPIDLRAFEKLDPPQRLLMGPGPSQVHPRVLAALAAPTVGHLDPAFLTLMDEVQALLRAAFGTDNALTFPVSGTGSAGMEACMANVLEPGDRVVVGQNGVFGGRMADIAARLGCEVHTVEVPFGQALDVSEIEHALSVAPTKLLAFVHAETSTGVCQPVPHLVELAQRAGALTLLDCVTSLGGIPVEIDAWGVDLAYSGTQKCLGCPPGLAPVTFSPRAVEVLKGRRTKVASWYLDASLLLNYWGGQRAYHHTAPINMIYALREALLLLFEEGLAAAAARHRLHQAALLKGLAAMGLEPVVAPELRLPQLSVVRVPDGVDDAALRQQLLSRYGIEVGGGLGAFKGEVLRIGLMGHTARRRNVTLLLSALEDCLLALGHPAAAGSALRASASAYPDARQVG